MVVAAEWLRGCGHRCVLRENREKWREWRAWSTCHTHTHQHIECKGRIFAKFHAPMPWQCIGMWHAVCVFVSGWVYCMECNHPCVPKSVVAARPVLVAVSLLQMENRYFSCAGMAQSSMCWLATARHIVHSGLGVSMRMQSVGKRCILYMWKRFLFIYDDFQDSIFYSFGVINVFFSFHRLYLMWSLGRKNDYRAMHFLRWSHRCWGRIFAELFSISFCCLVFLLLLSGNVEWDGRSHP